MDLRDCARVVRLLEAFDDDELDSVTSFAVQEHLDACPRCRARHAWAGEVRASLGRLRTTTPPTPSALRARILHEFEVSRRKWLLTGAGIAAALIAAVLVGVPALTRSSGDIVMDFVRNHHASVERPDVVSVASIDPDVVGRWLSERLPFAVTMPSRPPEGYQLAGARLCKVGRGKVGYALYTSPEGAPVSLFIGRRHSYNLNGLPVTNPEREIDPDPVGVKIRCGECDGTTVAAWDVADVTYIATGDVAETAMLAFARQFGSLQ